MLPDRVSNPGPLTYESCALPIALRGPAKKKEETQNKMVPLRQKTHQVEHRRSRYRCIDITSHTNLSKSYNCPFYFLSIRSKVDSGTDH